MKTFKELWSAYYETSETYRSYLMTEITRRVKNQLQLEEECSEQENLIKIFQNAPNANNQIANLQAHLDKCRELLRAENDGIDDLGKRMIAATRENRMFVRKKAKTSLETLREAKVELERELAEERRLDDRYQDQAAGFSRQSFLTFSILERGKHHPRHVANAWAGLPEMACKQSYSKCQRISFHGEPQRNFQIFELFDRAWANRDVRKPQDFGNLVMKKIRDLPKTREFYGTRVANYFREELLKKATMIRLATDAALQLKPRPHPQEVPYVATRKFLESISPKPTSALERVLFQKCNESSSIRGA